MKKKIIDILCAMLVLTMLVSCVGQASAPSPAAAPDTAAPTAETATAAPAKEKVLRRDIISEPRTIDPSLNSELSAGTVMDNCFEGLLGYEQNGTKLVPVGAESYTVSPDGLVYTFKLRKDEKWSNGEDVTADAYQFAFLRVLDPAMAADYATEFYCIKNGENYNAGECEASDVGIKVVDDYTLEVTLEYPAVYFLSLLPMFFAYPLYQPIVESDPDWAIKPETYIGNGPFKLAQWLPKDKFIIVKNENYRDAANVKLDRVEMHILSDPNSALATYESGDVDVLIGNLPPAMVPQLLADGKAKSAPYFCTTWMQINVSDNAMEYDPVQSEVLLDQRVRKALNLAIDRNVIVNNVTQAGEMPATSFVPSGIIGPDGKDYRNKEYYKAEGDVAEAKRLLAEAGYPDGQGFPELTYTNANTSVNPDVAQAVQAMWKTNLNITLNIENIEYGVLLNRRSSSNRQYTLCYRRWIGDYLDPQTFLNLFTYATGKNYNSPEYDEAMLGAASSPDPVKRFEYMHQAEDILMNDMPFVLLYYLANPYMAKDYVKNLYITPTGFVYMKYVDIEQ